MWFGSLTICMPYVATSPFPILLLNHCMLSMASTPPVAFPGSAYANSETSVVLARYSRHRTRFRLTLSSSISFRSPGGGYGNGHQGTLSDSKICVKRLRDLLPRGRGWKRLTHPNILFLLGVTTDPPPPQLVSNWMPGGELLAYVKNNPNTDRVELVGTPPVAHIPRLPPPPAIRYCQRPLLHPLLQCDS